MMDRVEPSLPPLEDNEGNKSEERKKSKNEDNTNNNGGDNIKISNTTSTTATATATTNDEEAKTIKNSKSALKTSTAFLHHHNPLHVKHKQQNQYQHYHPQPTNENIVGLKNAAKHLEDSMIDAPKRTDFLKAASSRSNARFHYAPSSTPPPLHTNYNNINIHYVDDKATIAAEISVEEQEKCVRMMQMSNPIALLILGFYSAFKVMFLYLINLATILSCFLTAGLTYYWYQYGKTHKDWNGGTMDFVLLAFAVTSPIAAAIGMAFTRREQALVYIGDFRSFSSQLYIAHSVWDWPENGGREHSDLELRAHSDAVLAQIVGVGDELARFLTLPTTSRSIHRMTKQGRTEAALTVEVAYRLLESMSRRIIRLSIYGERIKAAGLPSGEVSRIRQYERFLEDGIERLRMIKMYRTPQGINQTVSLFPTVHRQPPSPHYLIILLFI
jgi:hypothetical protein